MRIIVLGEIISNLTTKGFALYTRTVLSDVSNGQVHTGKVAPCLLAISYRYWTINDLSFKNMSPTCFSLILCAIDIYVIKNNLVILK